MALLLGKNIGDVEFSNYRWLPPDNPIDRDKRYLDDEFNHGENLIALVRLPDSLENGFFSAGVYEELDAVVAQLRAIDKVSEVTSPLHAKTILKDAAGSLHNVSFQSALERGLLSRADYPKQLRESPYWLRLISADARGVIVSLSLDVDPDSSNTALRAAVYENVHRILGGSALFTDYGFAGETELTHRIDVLSKRDFRQLLPWAAALMLFLLALTYRRLGYVLIPASVTALALMLAMNINQWLGYSLNVVSASLPVLIMVIAIADSIHVIRRWQINAAASRDSLVRVCAKETWLPCLCTSLTSAVGFGVFHFSELLPLSHFGATAFLSVLAAYPVILVGTLSLLYVARPETGRIPMGDSVSSMENAGQRIERITRFAAAKRNPLLLASLCVGLASLALMPLASSESNFLDVFFKHHSPTFQTFTQLDDKFSGGGGIDVILQSDEPDTFNALENFNRLREQVARQRTVGAARSIASMLEPIAMVHRPLSDAEEIYPRTDEGLAQEILFLEFSRSDTQADVLSEYVDFNYQNSRTHIYTPNMKSREVEETVRRELNPILAALPFRHILTGSNIYFQKLSEYVLRAQFQSILLTGGMVWLLFVLLFGLKLGCIGFYASAIPVIAVLGAQIILRVPFDFATVLVASVCLGLCIDDCIHYLHRYNSHRAKESALVSATQAARDLWQPIVVTSMLLICGFLVLLASDLVVINRFAIFTAIAIGLSLLSVFFVLPAMLQRFDQ